VAGLGIRPTYDVSAGHSIVHVHIYSFGLGRIWGRTSPFIVRRLCRKYHWCSSSVDSDYCFLGPLIVKNSFGGKKVTLMTTSLSPTPTAQCSQTLAHQKAHEMSFQVRSGAGLFLTFVLPPAQARPLDPALVDLCTYHLHTVLRKTVELYLNHERFQKLNTVTNVFSFIVFG
jgi:hypothetical protein